MRDLGLCRARAWLSLVCLVGASGCTSVAEGPKAASGNPAATFDSGPVIGNFDSGGSPEDTVQPLADTEQPDAAGPGQDAAATDGEGAVDAAEPDVAPTDLGEQDAAAVDAGAPGLACASADDCPIATNPCRPKACVDGTCAYPAVADGTPCEDGNACTAADTCVAGTCTPLEVLGTSTLPGWGHGTQAWAMLALPSGGFALAGEATPTAGGTADAWLAVTDSAGAVTWQANYGGTGFENARALVRFADGSYALAGSTSSQGKGLRDGLVVRTDAAGTASWTTAWGDKQNDEFHGLAVLADGKLIAAGQTSSKGAGLADAWLVGLSAGGSVLWQSTFGHAQDDDAAAVVAVPAGGFLAAGTTRLPGQPHDDVWVLRADANGKPAWEKTFGGKADDRGWAALALADGGFAVLGETGEPKAAGHKVDFWLLRLDATGNMLWDNSYGGSEFERGYALAQTGDGGFALTGYTGTFGVGLWSTWLVRTGSDGQVHWQQAYGTPQMDRGQAVVALPGGGVAVAGQVHDQMSDVDQALLVRADQWGSAACTQGGACASLTLAACDDANPCTTEGCSASVQNGCLHADLPNGTVCGVGLACAAGVCLAP